MTEKFFEATRIVIGYCAKPDCRSVHIQLLDADDVPCAQAVIACENIEDVIADIRLVCDHVRGANTSLARH